MLWTQVILLPLVGWAVFGVPGLWGMGWLSLVIAVGTGMQFLLAKRGRY
jgi:hypothetical protein